MGAEGGGGGRGGGGGEAEIICVSATLSPPDFYTKIHSDNNHFNVSLIGRDNLKSKDSVHRPDNF